MAVGSTRCVALPRGPRTSEASAGQSLAASCSLGYANGLTARVRIPRDFRVDARAPTLTVNDARGRVAYPMTANTIGYILQVGFSIMATVALEGMTCYAHPNGSYSLVKFSGVICGGGEQTAMMVAGWFLLVIFAIGFLVVIVYATYAIPSWSARNWSRRVQCFNFLTNRFRLDKWWFGIPLILRGPLMSLVVTCATDFPAVQVCLNSLILAMYFAIQTLGFAPGGGQKACLSFCLCAWCLS
eukprot:Skav234526  [mRNA]  locus=scaffold2556:67358:75634:+ [translate_table: standard]